MIEQLKKVIGDTFPSMAAPPEGKKPAYDEGVEAGKAGAECWENPHVLGTSLISEAHRWHAGWCVGRQVRAGGIAD